MMFNKSNLIGIGFFISLLMFGIGWAMIGTGQTGFFSTLSSPPSFLVVISFLGLTYSKRSKYKYHELGLVIKKDLIMGGWIGFLIGLIIIFAHFQEVERWPRGISAALVPVLYGYIYGMIFESCWPGDES